MGAEGKMLVLGLLVQICLASFQLSLETYRQKLCDFRQALLENNTDRIEECLCPEFGVKISGRVFGMSHFINSMLAEALHDTNDQMLKAIFEHVPSVKIMGSVISLGDPRLASFFVLVDDGLLRELGIELNQTMRGIFDRACSVNYLESYHQKAKAIFNAYPTYRHVIFCIVRNRTFLDPADSLFISAVFQAWRPLRYIYKRSSLWGKDGFAFEIDFIKLGGLFGTFISVLLFGVKMGLLLRLILCVDVI